MNPTTLAYKITVGDLECRQIFLAIARGYDALEAARATVKQLARKQLARKQELKAQERRLAALRRAKGGRS